MRKELIFLLLGILLFFAPIVLADSSPKFLELGNDIYICENSQEPYKIRAEDKDGDVLDFGIFPKILFFIEYNSTEENISSGQIYFSKLNKGYIGKYEREVFISDKSRSESKKININVLEINNPPVIEDIKVETIALNTSGNFSKKIYANDIESGNQDSEKLIFTLEFISGDETFNIAKDGLIESTFNQLDIGKYKVKVCVRDEELPKNRIHENIQLCGQNGKSLVSCKNFELVITQENSPPTIMDSFPEKKMFSTSGNINLEFNISSFDPEGLRSDIYWYVDDKLEHFSNSADSESFEYFFGCGVFGKHMIRADITDGLLNDSVEWEINVIRIPCDDTTPLTTPNCIALPACQEWDVCQNSEQSHKAGLLSDADLDSIKNGCALKGLNDSECGFQIRECDDLNNCVNSSIEIMSCKYSFSPSCEDGIKNCHDKLCEIVPDCGGPCNSCPTCSDNTKNQNELGIDCGGACEMICPEREKTRLEKIVEKKQIQAIVIAMIIVLIPVLIYLAKKIISVQRNITLNMGKTKK